MLATSPFAQMRSAPTITHCTCPVFIRCDAAASAIRVASMPSCCSSHTVSRAPCSQGRVSPAKTRSIRSCATPARITPSAVPKPAVASEPVLQWVNTPLPLAISCAPSLPILWFAARSSVAMACASRNSTVRQSSPALVKARRMRCSAQARLTAVGRAALRCSMTGSRRSAASAAVSTSPPLVASSSRAANTTPQAAAMPIAGAPRTISAWIASATAPLLRQATYSTMNGSLRWSSSSRVSPVQRIGRMRS